MIGTRKAVALLDMASEYQYTGPIAALDFELAEIGATALRDTWPHVALTPRVLDWLPACRGVVIGQDTGMWFYSIAESGMWWHPSVSGPGEHVEKLDRCKSLARAKLLCEQHRRQRRIPTPTTATAASAATTTSGR